MNLVCCAVRTNLTHCHRRPVAEFLRDRWGNVEDWVHI